MRRAVLLSFLLPFLSLSIWARPPSEELAQAANAWLVSLTEEQRELATFAFGDEERLDWHYVPRVRRGLPLKVMTQEQRLLAHSLLATALSHRGLAKATGIMSLESVLAALENNPVRRDPENYFVTVFGTPGEAPWGWRFEGHHLALNFTVPRDGSAPVFTPTFMGANPATVREGPRSGYRALAAEEDLARALIDSLSNEQRGKAIIMAEAPREIFNVPGRNVTEPEGIAWDELTGAQKERLLDLVREYVFRFRPDVAAQDLQKLEAAGFDTLHFGWAGSTELGQPHYYRVQGGSFVLEYDNTQNGGNHAHTVWRDFDREFGADLLAEHYEVAHADSR